MQHTTHVGVNLRPYLLILPSLLVAAFVAMAMSPGAAYAVTAAEKQAEAEAALASLTAMQESLDQLSADYGEALAAQEKAEARCEAAEKRIGEIKDELEDVQGRLGERAREMYRSGGISFLEIILGSRSFQEFATSFSLVTKMNQADADLIDEERALKAEAEEQAAEFEEQAQVAAQKSQEAEAAAAQAEQTVAEMQATYDSLNAEAQQLLEEERAAREAEEAARAAAVLAEAEQRAREEEEARRAAEQAQDEGQDEESTDEADEDSYEEESYDDSPSYEGGSDVVSRAEACLGAPYVWGGVGPKGYDCSGLVSYALTGSHVRLGTTYTFMEWPTVKNPVPGDVAVNWTHTGIYIGNGQMIHASTYGVGVIVGPVQSGMKFVRYPG